MQSSKCPIALKGDLIDAEYPIAFLDRAYAPGNSHFTARIRHVESPQYEGAGMIAAVTNHILMDRVREFLATEQGLELFNERFSRCRTLLESTASRMLSCPEKVELVVYNCWLAGFRSPPTFDSEGEFRRWLFRLLISEAQAILHQNHLSSTASHQPNAFAQPRATVEQQRGLQNASR